MQRADQEERRAGYDNWLACIHEPLSGPPKSLPEVFSNEACSQEDPRPKALVQVVYPSI